MKIAKLILLGAFALGVTATAQAAPSAPKLHAPGAATTVAHTVKHVKKKPRHAHAHHAHKHSAAHVHAKHKAHPHKVHKVKKVKH